MAEEQLDPGADEEGSGSINDKGGAMNESY